MVSMIIKLEDSLLVNVLDPTWVQKHLLLPGMTSLKSPHNQGITYLIAHFTIINIISILRILTILNAVFIKTIPVRLHYINIVQLVIQKFYVFPFIFYTIFSAWWWHTVRSRHVPLITYTLSCDECHCIIINNVSMTQSVVLSTQPHQVFKIQSLTASAFCLVINRMAVSARYECAISDWYTPKKDLKIRWQGNIWNFNHHLTLAAQCGREPFRRVNYAQYILTYPLMSFGHWILY